MRLNHPYPGSSSCFPRSASCLTFSLTLSPPRNFGPKCESKSFLFSPVVRLVLIVRLTTPFQSLHLVVVLRDCSITPFTLPLCPLIPALGLLSSAESQSFLWLLFCPIATQRLATVPAPLCTRQRQEYGWRENKKTHKRFSSWIYFSIHLFKKKKRKQPFQRPGYCEWTSLYRSLAGLLLKTARK